MLGSDRSTSFSEAAERESARREYPKSFPPLPEIPGGRYADKTFFALEMEHVWKKTWLFAAHASQIPKPGSYIMFEHLDLSIIICRTKNGEIKARHNVCRHRGAPLILDGSGDKKLFTCPYHAWSYNLDGELVAVPEEFNFACLEKARRGLIPVKCETWRGFVFINLDDRAEPLLNYLGPVIGETHDYPLDELKVQKTAQIEIACNWKAMFDNFIEAYHVATLHPRTLFPYLDPTTMNVTLYKNGHIHMKTKKKVANQITDGKDVKAPVSDDKAGIYNDYVTAYPLFPNVQLGLEPSGFAIQTYWPIGPDKALMDIRMLGVDSEGTDVPDYWDQKMAITLGVVEEDLFLMSRIQKSLESEFYTGSLLSYTERAIYWYHEEIDRRIGLDRLPAHLRVEQVLGDHVAD